MDDDDIFNSITGVTTPTVQTNISPPAQKQEDDPFGLMGLSVGGNTQPQNTFNQPTNGGFDMGLLGFGSTTPPTQQVSNNQQTAKQAQSNGGFNLLGEDFLGMGNSQPTQQPVNVNPPQNAGFSFNQPQSQPQSQGFSWGNEPAQQTPANQPEQNGNKFLAYDNPQIQIWMSCVKESADTAKIIATYVNKTQTAIEGLTVQVAVMKHLKLTINPLSNTTLPPLSK